MALRYTKVSISSKTIEEIDNCIRLFKNVHKLDDDFKLSRHAMILKMCKYYLES